MTCFILPTIAVCFLSPAWQAGDMDLAGVDKIEYFASNEETVFAAVEYEEGSARGVGILAIEMETSSELWYYEIDQDDNFYLNLPYQQQYCDGRIYSLVSFLGILCLDAISGEELFLWECGSYIHAPFIFNSGNIYTATAYDVIKLDALTGDTLWVLPVEGENSDFPLTLSHLLLGCGRLLVGSIQTPLFCVDPAKGEIIWSNEDIQGWQGSSYSEAIHISEDLVFVTSSSEEVAVFDADDGSLITFYDNSSYLESDGQGIYIIIREEDDRYLCTIDPVSGSISNQALLDNE